MEEDKVLKENLQCYGYEDIVVYKELTPAFLGISVHDMKLCYDSTKLPEDISSFPIEDYHIVNLGEEPTEESASLHEKFYDEGIIGVTDGNRIVYALDKITDILANEFAKGDGKLLSELDDDKQYEYYSSAREYIDYNIIRSLPYDILHGKPMPIVMDDEIKQIID